MSDLATQAEQLATGAGVYLFKGADGEVLYVGKANNLRARVRQYVQGHDERFMVRFLLAAAARVEVVPVSNEKEALILENSLIKQHQPRYNVKLRDDKAFLHLRIDPKAAWPRFTLVRRPREDGARYFGPYHSATSARATLQFVQRSFPLRTCTDAVLRSRRRPCLLHQMHRCVAPCVGLTTEAAYAEILGDATLFLSGRDRDLVRTLEARMTAAAEAERYEEAGRLRDLIKALTTTLDRQSVADLKLGERDAWGIHREGGRGAIACLPVRAGLMREPHVWTFDAEIEDDAALLSGTLNTWYGSSALIPPEILLPLPLGDAEALQELLAERREGRVALVFPQRGEKVRLLDLARGSAEARYTAAWSEQDRLNKALDGLAELLGLDAPPYRIECYDNSNLLGEDPVASQVVFIEGRPARPEYRRYKVKTVVGADDFATMREILGRRMRRAAEEGSFPDLLVVDGGKGQLGSALEALRELGLEGQPVIGLSKPRTERRRGDNDAVDKIIVPGRDEPLILSERDPTLRLLQHLRDEAHRTAIGFHRKTRSKSKLHSALEDLPGVGPVRRQALLKHFGSMAAIRAASVDELAAAPGVGRSLAEKLRGALSGNTPSTH